MDLMDGFDGSMWVDDGMHGMGWFRLISSLFRTWFGPNSNQLASGACFAHSAQVWTCCKDWLRSFSNSRSMATSSRRDFNLLSRCQPEAPPLLIWLLAPVTRGSGRCDDNVFTIALRTQVYGEMSYHKGHSNK